MKTHTKHFWIVLINGKTVAHPYLYKTRDAAIRDTCYRGPCNVPYNWEAFQARGYAVVKATLTWEKL